jgi:hypothetical protein
VYQVVGHLVDGAEMTVNLANFSAGVLDFYKTTHSVIQQAYCQTIQVPETDSISKATFFGLTVS